MLTKLEGEAKALIGAAIEAEKAIREIAYALNRGETPTRNMRDDAVAALVTLRHQADLTQLEMANAVPTT